MLSKNQIKLIRSLELKKNRKREGLFVAEGPKVVNDLLTAGYKARAIYSTNDQISDDDYSIKEQITEEEHYCADDDAQRGQKAAQLVLHQASRTQLQDSLDFI